MATRTIVYSSPHAIQAVPCQDVVLCLKSAWADETVSGTRFVTGKLQHAPRHLGNAFFLGGFLDNPRGQDIIQYHIDVDDTQFSNPGSAFPTCDDILHVDGNPCELLDDNEPPVE